MTQLRRHPDNTSLTLFAGGDLGLVRRWLVGRHVLECPQCRAAVSAYRVDRERLRQELPVPEIDFAALAHRVRVTAEQGGLETPPRAGWRWKTAAAAGLVATAAILALVVPNRGVDDPDPQRAAVQQLHPDGQAALFDAGAEAQVTARGSLSARAFHPGSGTMTITEYYAP